MGEILPGPDVQESMKESLLPLVLRVLTRHCPVYKDFAKAVEHHLPHQCSSQMKRKSEQVREGY